VPPPHSPNAGIRGTRYHCGPPEHVRPNALAHLLLGQGSQPMGSYHARLEAPLIARRRNYVSKRANRPRKPARASELVVAAAASSSDSAAVDCAEVSTIADTPTI
jgi:hypothetical protein